MKKIFAVFIVFSVLMLSGCNFLAEDETEKIEVDYSNYIKISTVEDLMQMDMNKSYELDQNIDMNGQEWVPMGTLNNPFRGHFRGNGYTISNFVITENNLGYYGLFGYMEGNIENLKVIQFSIDISSDFLVNVGGLAGVSYGSINNVYVDGSIRVSSPNSNVYAGLLVGNSNTSLQKLVIANEFKPVSLSNNIVKGNIEINHSDILYAGGLIGKSQNISISENEVNDVSISASAKTSGFIGGVVGHNFLYDIESTDASLSVDKDLVFNNIIEIDMIVDETPRLSLGGIAGYNQNVNIINNFTLLSFDVSVEDYLIGLVVGENWSLDISKNLSVLTSYTSEFDTLQTHVLGTYVGKNYLNAVSEEGLYASYIDIENFDNQVSQVDVSHLNLISFYQEEFPTLESDFINRIIELLFAD
ncbi:hypothetical protein KHQ88_03320 [Mycoplasmatota bacterium]|nr:hypothetical protein KHQ88_03320 [Mycoplasmatota bacterium]